MMFQPTVPPTHQGAPAPGQLQAQAQTPAAPARGVLQRHLLMALHCHDEAARLQQLGDAEGALRQQRLMGVFLHNALEHLPSP